MKPSIDDLIDGTIASIPREKLKRPIIHLREEEFDLLYHMPSTTVIRLPGNIIHWPIRGEQNAQNFATILRGAIRGNILFITDDGRGTEQITLAEIAE